MKNAFEQREQLVRKLEAVRVRIADAARRAGRNPNEVCLVLATKTQPPAALRAAHEAGAREFGENYVQEAVSKRAALSDLGGIRWHMIGHLQTNKAKLAVANFELIQSLDSQRLAATVARLRPEPKMPVLIEVRIGDEAGKSGVPPRELEALVDAVRNQVDIRGLMTIPPEPASSELAREQFARTRAIRERLAAATGLALSELSMGMTADFEVAIEEGATIVRIGRAVFGERPK